MARTTVDIDAPILAELKRVAAREGRSLGRVISDLLAQALPRRGTPDPAPPLTWTSSPGRLRVDPLDKEAIYAVLDREAADDT